MKEEILAELGLTPLETKLYLTLLTEGPSISGTLARKTNAHRRNVYDALDRLLTKGLVGYMKDGNIKRFRASSPTIILEQLRAKQKEWEELMPAIEANMESWDTKKETLFFRGKEGIKNVFLDQITKKETVFVIATSYNCEQSIAHFFPKYHLLRKEENIKMHMLFDESVRKENDFSIIKKQHTTKIKTLTSLNTTRTSKYIYGDTVAIITWHENPFAIIIREPQISLFEKEQFLVLWNEARTVR